MVPPASICSAALISSSTFATRITPACGGASGGAFGNHDGIELFTGAADGNSAPFNKPTLAFERREIISMNVSSLMIIKNPEFTHLFPSDTAALDEFSYISLCKLRYPYRSNYPIRVRVIFQVLMCD